MTTHSTYSNLSTRSRRTTAAAAISDNDVQYFLLQTAVLLAKQQLQAAFIATSSSISDPTTPNATTASSGNAPSQQQQALVSTNSNNSTAAILAAAKRNQDGGGSGSGGSKVDAWVSGISALSLSGLVSSLGSGSGSVKFPEKMLKRLNERLQAISFGRDSSYSNLKFRATVGAFYGQLNEARFMARMRQDRKIEDLIIAFVTTAQKRLTGTSPAAAGMSPEERTAELESQVGSFVKVIRECLRQMHGVPKELTDRLEKYSAAFAGAPIVLGGSSSSGGDQSGPSGSSSHRDSAITTSSLGTASGMAASQVAAQSPPLSNTPDYTTIASSSSNPTDSRRTSTATSLSAAAATSLTAPVVPTYSDPSLNALMDHPLIQTVGNLFHENKDQLRKDVDYMRTTCTEEAYMIDLKHCVRAIHLAQSWPGRRSDFPSSSSTAQPAGPSSIPYPPFDSNDADRVGDEEYGKWRAQELADLSTTMAEMCKRNPALLKVNSKEPIPESGRTAGEMDRPDSGGEAGGEEDENGDSAGAAASGFTFLPPDPRTYYRHTLSLMLAHDLEAIMHFSDEEVSVGILSQAHLVLLDEIARCWRVSEGWKRAVRLEVIRERYEAGQCPLDSVDDAVRMIVAPALAKSQSAPSSPGLTPSLPPSAAITEGWMNYERKMLSTSFDRLFRSIMRWLYEAYQDPLGADVEDVLAHAALVQEIHATGLLLEHADPNLRPPSPTKPFGPQNPLLDATRTPASQVGMPPNFTAVNLDKHIEELRDAVQIAAINQYAERTAELFGQILPPDSNEIQPLLELRDWLESRAKKLNKRWGSYEWAFGNIDVVGLVLEKQVPLFLDDLESMKKPILGRAYSIPITEPGSVQFDQIFHLFHKVRGLFELYAAFCPEQMVRGAEEAGLLSEEERPEGERDESWPSDRLTGTLEKDAVLLADVARLGTFSLSRWFEPHVWRWLGHTELKVNEWVHNALVQDRFEPVDPDVGALHSSSIDILFNALQQPVDFVLGLDWPDKLINARFLNGLAKIVSRAVERYCAKVEELFKDELRFSATALPPGAGGVGGDGPGLNGEGGMMETESSASKGAAWMGMARAKLALQGAPKVEPFHFQPRSCVKLNNIEAARNLLDKLYSKMDADEQARIVNRHAPPPEVPEKPGQAVSQPGGAPQAPRQRFLFTVKIVLGEGLSSVSSSSSGSAGSSGSGSVLDSFVTLSDEFGKTVAKTRTITESADPRWDETVDLAVEGNMWLAATVWSRRKLNDPQLCGQTYLRLDPRLFGDFLPHELWLDLDTRGRLLIRVSMEGEKDDILFHFGRAFRILKRAESDMIRAIVDKMSIYIRQSLSRQVLKSLVKKSGELLDKALGNVKALYASALASTQSNTPMIPPVASEAEASSRIKKPNQLTDQEIEEPILPLLDYLDECLGTLKSSLSDAEAQLVLKKVWKEVLKIIEDILVPPLSDTPAVMQPLSDREVDIVFKWLQFLRGYFNARDEETGEEAGVPLEVLQGPKYREIISYSLFHDMGTDQLLTEIRRLVQQRDRAQLAAGANSAAGGTRMATRKKSVYNQRNLKTIRQRKREKTEKGEEPGSLELLLRLLRMRPGAGDYLPEMYRFAGVTGAGARQDKFGQAVGPGKSGGLSGPGGRRPGPGPMSSPGPGGVGNMAPGGRNVRNSYQGYQAAPPLPPGGNAGYSRYPQGGGSYR
ncbi:hypothetical protein OC846_001890 [Tilletia horrida]|uniref:Uncharacterized protein n=1 Tax=Tilletia horrida TaxID=155126 RepID=A0AAN6JT44_9BASI|nr:hypothetical protein OC845_001826 [Tilletia horrida]KAK0554940.1 hypothetical protein OC846_001890 [Tilletia horrida]KAK0568350.1 hypothetical protein OC861_002062 [Tilletia horrida]